MLLFRNKVLRLVRKFFDGKDFCEVVTPVFCTSLPLEPSIYSFETTWKNQKLYLATSPEDYLKRALNQGLGNCYSIGHSFRNLEDIGRLHRPEFLMLEWYRQTADMNDIIKDFKALILYLVQRLDLVNDGLLEINGHRINLRKWQNFSLNDLFTKYLSVPFASFDKFETIKQLAASKGYNTKNCTWEQLFNQLFLNEIEPKLPKDNPVILSGYPVCISPLAKPQKNNPLIADRFEIIINGIEIANGNVENLDKESIRKAFQQESEFRLERKLPSHPYKDSFVDGMKTSSEIPIAGIGVGIERLLMVLSGNQDISKVTFEL